MPFPIPRPVIDGLPSTVADGAGPSQPAGLPGRFNDGASCIDNGRHLDAVPARLRPHRRLDTSGRPTVYTAEIAQRVLDGLKDGRTLLDVCDDEGMPAPRTVKDWVMDDHQGFAARYWKAREAGCDIMADEVVAIADDGRNDWMLRRMADGRAEPVVDHEHSRRSAIRIDARRWWLAKRMPRVYGARPEPEAQSAPRDTLAEFLKAIDGKSRGLPSEDVHVRMDDNGKWVIDGGEHDGEPA